MNKRIKEISNLSRKDWIKYRKQNSSELLNSYPNYKFNIRFIMMKQFKKIMDEENITLYLSGGALLGAKRDKDFIPWDGDVDFDALEEELKPKCNIIKNKLMELGYITRVIDEYPKIKINAFYSGEKVGVLGLYLNEKKKERYRYKYSWPSKIYKEKEKINFKGVTFDAPKIVDYIEHTYGSKWKEPIKENFFTKQVYRTNG